MMKIVIIGGGFGGIYLVKNLLKYFKDKKEIEILLINKNNYFLFTPLLHEVATGSISLKNIIEPIREILKANNFNFIETEVSKIDFNKKLIYHNQGKIKYDYVIVSIGSTENYFNVKHAQKYCFSLKNLNNALQIKNKLIEALEPATISKTKQEKQKWLRFVVVGGGPTGVELIAEVVDFVKQAIKRNYNSLLKENPEFFIIQKNKELVPMFNEKTRNNAAEQLKKKGVNIIFSSEVNKVTKDYVEFNHKQKISSYTVIWTSGVKPNKIEVNPKSSQHLSGHFNVNQYLEIKNTKNAYAIGDCALFFNEKEKKPIPSLAQVAVDEADYVAKHIKSKINNFKIERYNFKPKGYLISLGQRHGAGNINGITLNGFFAWWLWRTIYLFKLLGYSNKARTVFDWTINLITRRRDTSKID